MRWAAILTLGALLGCNVPFMGDCTTLFAIVPLTVVDTSGAPVSTLSIVDTVSRTHQGFTNMQSPNPAGWYDVFDDGDRGFIRPTGETIKVYGSQGATPKFSATFVVAAGDCHVTKVSGPDTVVVH